MKIQIGEVQMDKAVSQDREIYPNKTRKYLLPCLKEYGATFYNKLKNVYKVAVGIGDVVISKIGHRSYERHLFILLNSSITPDYFLAFLDYIKDHPSYEDDYVFGNIQKTVYHMVVIKFPEKYYDAFDTFKEGKYSEMFNQETIKNFFKKNLDVSKVLVKDHNYKVTFTKELNDWLWNIKDQDKIKPEEWEWELDFPPTKQDEFFNDHLNGHREK